MNSNDFDTSQKYKIKSSECTQIKCKQTSWESRKCTLSKLSRFLKVTKPILLLSSFGEFTNVLYNDKGLSSVMPVYKLSMTTILLYRSRRFIVSRVRGGPQTHSYGGPIFKIFFLPERYSKMMMDHCFLFSIFWFFKAVGPKMSFSLFFVARP